MHILRLRLRNFRKFADLEIEFAPGLNVVKGPNEAGKTTLQRAIALALLGRPTGNKGDKLHQAWTAERMYRLEIDCRMADGRDHPGFTINLNNRSGQSRQLRPSPFA